MLRTRLPLAATVLLAAVSGTTAVTPALAASPAPVIAQVYGGGGNSSAPVANDYVVLFNRGDAPASLDGWSLQYASATGSGNLGANTGQLTPLSGSIPAGGSLLVREAGGATGTALPAADVTDDTPINLSASSGKVALVDQAASVGCNGSMTPCDPAQRGHIVDLVGYGSADFFEGKGPAPAASNTVAVLRGGQGCADTDDNAADLDTGAPAPANSASPTVSCSTPPPPPPPASDAAIHEIQGAGHRSPLEGQRVTTTGIVTALRSNGFYLQDPSPDASDATSEGIFAFTGAAPAAAVGDRASVQGNVAEFRPGGSRGTGNLTQTELTSPAITITASGQALPAPTVVGPGGRVPPTSIIENDAFGSVETGGTFDPAQDGIDFYESMEGMRVSVADAVAVGPTDDFGSNREIPALAAGGAGASVRTPRGGIVVRPDDFNPERIILNDELSGGPTLPAADVGDTFPGTTVGVLDYSFGNFKLEVSSLPAVHPGGLTRETTPVAQPGELAFATFNVQNLDPGDPQAKFDRLARTLVENLRSPDVVSLEEVQDDNGATGDGTVDATATYRRLTDAISAAGGPAYSVRQIDPVDGQDGGEPGGNIRVGFMYRTDRGLDFVDRPGGTPTSSVAVTGPSGDPQLSASPGRIDPTDPAFDHSRKPLAGEFSYGGRRWFVVANHFNSKGGDQSLFGRFQPPTLSSETQRLAQAKIVHDFVAQLLAKDPAAKVVVLGDLNDFPFSRPLQTLTGSPRILEDLITRLDVGEQYTYEFEGNAQALDHVLASDGAAARLSRIDAVHVNSEFADQVSDHDPVVAAGCADQTPPQLRLRATPDVLSPPNHRYRQVDVAIDATDAGDPAPTVTLVSATSSEPDNGKGDGNTTDDIVRRSDTRFDLRAERAGGGPGRVYTLTYRATDRCGNTTTTAVGIRVPAGSKKR